MSQPSEKPKWVRIAEQFEQSGLTQKQFSQQQQVPLSTLQSWLSRRRRQAASPRSVRLLPVEVAAGPALSPRGVEVCTPGGVRVSFETGTDVEYVARLVGALGRTSC